MYWLKTIKNQSLWSMLSGKGKMTCYDGMGAQQQAIRKLGGKGKMEMKTTGNKEAWK